ncbi:hypothetical protein [Actinophytocola sediminis]
MKLGRACAAGAVLWAVALPLTAGTALADDEPSAPVATTPPATEAPAPPSANDPKEPEAAPPAPDRADPTDRREPPRAVPAPGDPQVSVRPDGAPETGGGPESGIDLAVAGGAASVVAVAAGGVLVALRRRAGAR